MERLQVRVDRLRRVRRIHLAAAPIVEQVRDQALDLFDSPNEPGRRAAARGLRVEPFEEAHEALCVIDGFLQERWIKWTERGHGSFLGLEKTWPLSAALAGRRMKRGRGRRRR